MNTFQAIQNSIKFIEDKSNSSLITTDSSYLQLKVVDKKGHQLNEINYLDSSSGLVYLVDYCSGLTLATVNWVNYEDINNRNLITITPYKQKNSSPALSLFYLHLLDIEELSDNDFLVQSGDENFHTKKPKKILKSFRINFSESFQTALIIIGTTSLIYWIPVIVIGFQPGLIIFLLLALLALIIGGMFFKE